MVQAIINVSEEKDRILNIVKAQQGFKNKSQAVEFIAGIYASSFLETELRPEYVEKLKKIDKKGNLIKYYKNLKFPLNELKRVHIDGSFVLIFKYDKTQDKIIFYDLDHHDKIYLKKF